MIHRQLQYKIRISKTSKRNITKVFRFQLKKITKMFFFQLGESLDHLRFFLELSILFPELLSFVRRYIDIELLTDALFSLFLTYQRRNRSTNDKTTTI